MRASKEEGQEALKMLHLITARLPENLRGLVQGPIFHVEQFLSAAIAKLPSEAAYEKDRIRRKQ